MDVNYCVLPARTPVTSNYAIRLNLTDYLNHVHQVSDAMSLSEVRELVLDREAWCAAIHGVTKNQTQLSN